MRVLVVEDDDAIASALEIGLKREGFDAVRAGSAAQALNSLPVDFILLDLGLPDMNGLSVLKQIREWTQTPVIILTAHDTEQMRAQARQPGVAGYFRKPVDDQALIDAIEWALSGRHESVTDH